MQEIICHIGFPKTGTTFLQKKVFPSMNGLNHIEKERTYQWVLALTEKDDSFYDNDKMKTTLLNFHNSNSNMLISDESLTGHHMRTEFPNRSQIARRLKAAGVNKIIISIRNQVDVLESTYKQYIKSGGVVKVSKFFNWPNNTMPQFYLDYFNYEKIVKLYSDIFGRENILVIQFEEMFKDDAAFSNALASFLQLKDIEFRDAFGKRAVNNSLSNSSTKLLQILNHFTFNSFRPSSLIHNKLSTNLMYKLLQIIDSPRKEDKLITKYRDEIRSHFLDSNSALMRNYNIQLHEKYHYKQPEKVV